MDRPTPYLFKFLYLDEIFSGLNIIFSVVLNVKMASKCINHQCLYEINVLTSKNGTIDVINSTFFHKIPAEIQLRKSTDTVLDTLEFIQNTTELINS